MTAATKHCIQKIETALFIFQLGCLLGSFFSTPSYAEGATCDRPWVFFDIGNTLVDTSDWKALKYMPGALEYLHELHSRQIPISVIANIPESWGSDEITKIDHLKSVIAETWKEVAPFPWGDFSSIFIPLKDSERKPAPILFVRAKERVPSGCAAVFEGDDAVEVEVAKQVGFTSYLVGQSGHIGEKFFMPIEDVLNAPNIPAPH